MELTLLSEQLAICRLAPNALLPSWATHPTGFFSMTRTDDELSVVVNETAVPDGVQHAAGWRALKVIGPLDFSLTGILAALANPLAEATISIFALSTFDTDYILVKGSQLTESIQVLRKAGHQLISAPSLMSKA